MSNKMSNMQQAGPNKNKVDGRYNSDDKNVVRSNGNKNTKIRGNKNIIGDNNGNKNTKIRGNKNTNNGNIIDKHAIVEGAPIMGDHSGNTTNNGNNNVVGSKAKGRGNTINSGNPTNSGNKKTEVCGNRIMDNRIMDNHNNEKCSYSAGTSNYGNGENGCNSFS